MHLIVEHAIVLTQLCRLEALLMLTNSHLLDAWDVLPEVKAF